MSEQEKLSAKANQSEMEPRRLSIIEGLDMVISRLRQSKDSAKDQDSPDEVVKKKSSARIKLTNFRKQFALSPVPKKKAPRKCSVDDEFGFDFNDIQPRKKALSMKFEEIIHNQKKRNANRMDHICLSKIKESDTETNGKESCKNPKISISSVELDTDKGVQNKPNFSEQSRDTIMSLSRNKAGSRTKPLSIISKFYPGKIAKQQKKSEEVSPETQGEKESYKASQSITLKNSQNRQNNFKGNKIFKTDISKDLFINKRISQGVESNKNTYFSEKARTFYKNNYANLISICENIREKKLNEISGKELVQYLSIPGISRIQKLVKQMKQELIRNRRMNTNLKGGDQDHDPLTQRIKILAYKLKTSLEKKITQLKLLAKQKHIGKECCNTLFFDQMRCQNGYNEAKNLSLSLTLQPHIFKRLRNNAPDKKPSRNKHKRRSIVQYGASKSIKFRKLVLPAVHSPKRKTRGHTRGKSSRNIYAKKKSIDPLMNHSFIS
ncbi:unnamed protein product [Moneuplotes crassus]|uniref:Uncharacterized protein n=1 Tax=Euplotes crassus TaxID=5936 RepID=A0AAD1X3I2_EUPCR|nr:unnamed protein product [Moneuplotes crassus]